MDAFDIVLLVFIAASAATSVSLFKRRSKAKSSFGDKISKTTADTDTRTPRLRFVYEDSQGNTSTREVTNWDDDGIYIEGYCHHANDVRTFRRDRIVSFLEGENLLKPLAPKLDDGGKGGGAMEILFTGFSAQEREGLEEDAASFGLLVRKTVTKNLDFVCAGPRAGPAKLAKARAQGCTVLDEEQFWALVEDGVMPN
ncbi:BRCT domain-containing protein [Billgrantia gudaonensis]|uniref:WYL domain-containing protein n=1 Tax=Billgrantia gudaonensis TaxID=376427 RepID=UPI001160014A|nr:BRCT domain-containing protein [Halomonas gudaonensis]